MRLQSARDRVWRELANHASRDGLRLMIDYPGASVPRLGPGLGQWHRTQRLIAAGLVLESETGQKAQLICAPFVASFLTWLSECISFADFDALGTPANRRILDTVLHANLSVSELCTHTGLSDSAVRAGLRELRRLDLVVAVQKPGRGRAWAALRPEVIADLLNGGDLIAARANQNLARDFQTAVVERSGWPLWMADEILPAGLVIRPDSAQDATDLAWLSLRRAFGERDRAPKAERQAAVAAGQAITTSDAYRLGEIWFSIGDEALRRVRSHPRPEVLTPEWFYGDNDETVASVGPPDPRDRCSGRWYWAYAATHRKTRIDPIPYDWHVMQLPTVEWAAVCAPFAATFDSAANRLTVDPTWSAIDAGLEPTDDHPEGRQLVRDALQLRLITHITTAEVLAAGSDLEPPVLDGQALSAVALGTTIERADLQRRMAAARRRLAKQHPTPL